MATDSATAAASANPNAGATGSSQQQAASGGGESDYLANQAAQAKEALSKTAAALAGSLKDGVDVRLWTKEYPWIAVGTAAVAGFFAASAVIPSKEQQLLKRLAKIQHAVTPPPPEHKADAEKGAHAAAEHGGILGTVLKELMAVVRPALVSLITSGLASAGLTQPPPGGGDGNPDGQGTDADQVTGQMG